MPARPAVPMAGRQGGRRRLAALALVLMSATLANPSAHAACGDALPATTRRAVQAGDQALVLAARPWPVPVGKHFALDIVLCNPPAGPATALQVDADMPAHRHGMNYRATVQALGGGRYRAEGLMFHMPGRWRLRLALGSGGTPQRGTVDLDVE